MKPSSDYPRMLFHRSKEPVTVQGEAEETALGQEWSRKIWPKEDEPEPEQKRDPPDQEEEGEDPDDPDFDDPAEPPEKEKAHVTRRAPSRRKKR